MQIRAVVLAFFVLAFASQAAEWTVIGPGGGGTLYLPTISPHDPNTVLTHCDMTGSYVTHDGGATWRMFNMRGVPGIFAFDPMDPKTMYANSLGLFRSNDAGRTWKLVYPDPAAVDRIVMPDDHAGERIVLKEGRAARISAFAIHPADSKKLYAVLSEGGGGRMSRGGPSTLQMSADYGKTWKKLTDLAGGARHIWVDRAGTIYIAGANSVGMFRDGVWRDGAPAPVDSFRSVSAGFKNGKLVVWAIGGGSIVISEDSGANWRKTELQPGSPAPNMPAIATSLNHPETAYVSYTARGGSLGFGVARSSDLGKTWEFVWQARGQETPANMHDQWMAARFGLGWCGAPSELGVAPNDPNICYGVTSGSAVKTTDGGKNWYGLYAKEVAGGGTTTSGLDVTTDYGVHFDPFDRKHIFISYTDIGLFASEDGGKSWASVTRTAPRPWVNTTYWMEFDPEVKGRAWAVMSGTHDLPRPKMWRGSGSVRSVGGVTISDDGGRTWRQAESLPPTAATHILLDPKSPKDSRTLYVAGFGRGVFKSTDGGKTWALKNNGIAGKDPFAWRFARVADGTLYVVIARRSDDGSYGNDGDGAIYRSRNGAESWERVPLPEKVNGPNGLAVDPADPKRLYLAAWGRDTREAAVDGGIYISTDAGATWKKALDRDQHVYDITVDPRNPKTLYACGFEDSAWRSRDRGATWERISGYNFKWGHRVIPDPYNPKMIYVTTFGGSVWYGPADGDPKAAEDIVTPVVGFAKK